MLLLEGQVEPQEPQEPQAEGARQFQQDLVETELISQEFSL